MAQQAGHTTAEPQGLQPRQYVIIGLTLTVITIIELAVSYSDIGAVMIPLLIGLSAVKFALVVALFMHLRYEPKLLTQVFTVSLGLAIAVTVALLFMLWADAADGVNASRAFFERVELP